MNVLSNRSYCIAAMAVLAAIPASGAGPDAFGYTASNQVPYSYEDIAATGAAVLAGADDTTATLNIGFPFRFYGLTYTSLCVSDNGLIAFGGCDADFANVDLSAQSPPGNLPLLAPLWTDLSLAAPGAGAVVYQLLGAPGARRFVLQWNNAFGVNGAVPYNFQVILYEGANNIRIQYLNVEGGPAAQAAGAGATVGIRAASGNTNGQYLQWSYNAAVLKDRTAIEFAAPGAVPLPVDVSSRVKVITSAFVLNRLDQTYSGTVTVINMSQTDIARPLTLVLTNLAAGVTLMGSAGSAAGGPYVMAPGPGVLGAGKSLDVPVKFQNPANAKITFEVRTYSGVF